MVHPNESEVVVSGNGHGEHVYDAVNGVAPTPDTYTMVRDVIEEVRGWKTNPPSIPSPEAEIHETLSRDAVGQFFPHMNRYRLLTNEEKRDLGELLDLTRFGAAYHMLRFHSVARATVDRLKQILAGEGPKRKMHLNETFGITESVVRTRLEGVHAVSALLDQNECMNEEDWEQLIANRDAAALQLCGMGVDMYKQGAIAKLFLEMRTKFLALPEAGSADRDALLKAECRTAEEMSEDIADVDCIRTAQKKVYDAYIHGNIGLVLSIVKNYRCPGLDLSEVISEGYLGLQRAIETFESKRGFAFTTYAISGIQQYIRHVLRDSRVPNSMPMISFSAPIGHGSKQTVESILSDTSTIMPEHAAQQSMLVSRTSELLKVLDERSRNILKLIYGLDGEKSHSLVEVAALLGVSKERVRQLRIKAIKKLKNPFYSQHLKQFHLDATSAKDESEE